MEYEHEVGKSGYGVHRRSPSGFPKHCWTYPVQNLNYLDYVVEITKDDETGTFVLTSPVESLKFKSYSSQISRKYTLNYGDDRYYIEITTVDFSYEYQDSSYNNEPVLMNFQGSFTMTKNVWKYQYPDVDVED
mgnify:CR=1 FL=1